MYWLTDTTLDSLVGKICNKIEVNERYLRLSTHKCSVIIGVEGDCCSYSWFSRIDNPENLKNSQILGIKDGIRDSCSHPEYDWLQTYSFIIETSKGDCEIFYQNSSNGYYGAYLLSVNNSTNIDMNTFIEVNSSWGENVGNT